jgi:uncharacterized protein (UPF0548 family)
VTYAPVGGTITSPPTAPAGSHLIDRTVRIGSGRARFEAAADAVLRWRVQRNAGLRVEGPPDAQLGARVVLGLGLGRVRLGAPCQVVAVVDEPTRRGFAYGTLPGHPESGEEAFLVSWFPDAPGSPVVLRIVAFSRPATRLARRAGPVGRLVQNAITRRYLRSLGPDTG